ncbi:hypothetical protein [Streptomyces sp. 061-3]|uniref:hypothetical protein n=1 Tax=Streptomyces sp. 061-3 TaxID=2789268 RepID=UPI003980F07D
MGLKDSVTGGHLPGTGPAPRPRPPPWVLTGPVRQVLAPCGIAVPASHVGFMDTDMAAHVPAGQKIDPASMATQALDGLQYGLPEILADGCSRQVEQSLAAQPAAA